MLYLGGKQRIAKQLAARINATRGSREIWEPFCGGCAVTEALGGEGLASDAHPALISLYTALRAGWQPPQSVSEDDYRWAKALPDASPLKAFIGFGCSYGGKYFGGYARDPKSDRNFAKNAASALKRAASRMQGFTFEHMSFFALTPGPSEGVIYCDPPYANTTGYSTGTFDHAAFYKRCVEWSRFCPVFVSEYALPIGRCVLEIEKKQEIGGNNTQARTLRIERLFLVGAWE